MSNVVHGNNDIANAKRLQDWLVSSGGYLHSNLRIAQQNGNKGFQLVYNGQPHNELEQEVAVSCPYASTFSILQASAVAPWWPVAFLDGTDTTTLSRLLLVEAYLQSEESAFYPYIAMLPQPTEPQPFRTPLYWENYQRLIIQETNLSTATVKREASWQQEVETARELLFSVRPEMSGQIALYSYDLYKWAATVLTSRCFPHWMLQSDELEPEQVLKVENASELAKSQIWKAWLSKDPMLKFPVLFPVLDLANHNPEARVTWRASRDGAQILTQVRGHPAGTEFHNNYGQKSNEELILGYGFELDNNPANSFLLSLRLSHSDSLKFARDLAREALPPADHGVLLPQILNPNTDIDKAPTIYALRYDQQPLTSAAATPLSLMVMNTRDLYARLSAPLNTPTLDPGREPARLAIATLIPFAEQLQMHLNRIESMAKETPPFSQIDRDHIAGMATRYRDSQLLILRRGVANLQRSYEDLAVSRQFVDVEDILTAVTPSQILKSFRQRSRSTFGTRDSDKIIKQARQEDLFLLWILNLCKELDASDNKSFDEAEDDDTLSAGLLRGWLAKMRTVYAGLADSAESEQRREAQLYWRKPQAATQKQWCDEMRAMLPVDIADLEVEWAARVVREEGMYIPSWLDNEGDMSSSPRFVMVIESFEDGDSE